MSHIRLSIVMGAYNEAGIITDSLEQLSKGIKDYLDPKTTEVILVCADSPDNTADVAQKSAKLFEHFNIVKPGKRVGKGRDIRAGMQAAKGDYKMFMDADMATPLHHLKQIQQFMDNNGEVGIGIRPLATIHKGMRKVISEIGNLLVQTMLTPGIIDSQCGFKIFRADTASVIFDRMTILGWGFDMELLVIANVHKYKIETFDIPDWSDPKEEGLTGDSSLAVAFKTGIELLTILKNKLFRKYA